MLELHLDARVEIDTVTGKRRQALQSFLRSTPIQDYARLLLFGSIFRTFAPTENVFLNAGIHCLGFDERLTWNVHSSPSKGLIRFFSYGRRLRITSPSAAEVAAAAAAQVEPAGH